MAGWVPLFDGKTMDHWIDPRALHPAGDAWTIEDGCLKAVPKPRVTEDLMSAETHGDFELQFDWRISPGGNSGVKYRIQALPILSDAHKFPRFEQTVDYALEHQLFDRSTIPEGGRAQIYVIGFEYQLIDNAVHPDARRGPLYQSGALYGIVPPTRDVTKPVGQFNHSRLVVQGQHVEHWLNDVKVVDVTVDAELLKHNLAKRWGESSPVYKLMTEQPKKSCPISLQNHGDAAWFRNVKIKKL